MYNSTCILYMYLVLVYIILVKKFSSYIRCLLFICKLLKGLKMIKFIMSNLQREPLLLNSKVKNCLKKTSICELTTLGTTC